MFLIKKTKSLSPITLNVIDAKIVLINNIVYMTKTDEYEKEYKTIIDQDYDLYKQLATTNTFKNFHPYNIHLNISSACNLACKLCYASKRTTNINWVTPEEVENFLDNHSGKNIILCGKEPTCNPFLDKILEIVNKKNNASIPTNGIKFSDIRYLNSLLKHGPFKATLSINGFSEKVYEKINSAKLLKKKLQAIKNLEKLNIPTEISMTICRNVNEKEIKPVFDFCLENLHWIIGLRIRVESEIGISCSYNQYTLSDLLNMFSKNTSINIDDIKKSGSFTRNVLYSLPNFIPRSCSFTFLLNKKKPNVLLGCEPCFDNIKLKDKDFLKKFINTYAMKKINNDYLLKRSYFRIELRSWPNIYNIDLDEIKKCPTHYYDVDSNIGTCFCKYNILKSQQNS